MFKVVFAALQFEPRFGAGKEPCKLTSVIALKSLGTISAVLTVVRCETLLCHSTCSILVHRDERREDIAPTLVRHGGDIVIESPLCHSRRTVQRSDVVGLCMNSVNPPYVWN